MAVGDEMSFLIWSHLGVNEVKHTTCIICVPYFRQSSKQWKRYSINVNGDFPDDRMWMTVLSFFDALCLLIASPCHQRASLTQLNKWEAFKTWLCLTAPSSLGTCLGANGPWICHLVKRTCIISHWQSRDHKNSIKTAGRLDTDIQVQGESRNASVVLSVRELYSVSCFLPWSKMIYEWIIPS